MKRSNFKWTHALWACAWMGLFLLVGCAGRGDANSPEPRGKGPAILTPDNTLAGKVVRVNESARIAVLEFPLGRMAAIDQRLFAYHQGLKAGEVKVTGPQQDDRIVADVISGEVKAGDEVRSY
jgi:hypothetical protein